MFDVPEIVWPLPFRSVQHNRKLHVIYGRCIFVLFGSMFDCSSSICQNHSMDSCFVFSATTQTIVKSTDCLPRTWSARHKQNSPADAVQLVAAPIEIDSTLRVTRNPNGRHIDYVQSSNTIGKANNPAEER